MENVKLLTQDEVAEMLNVSKETLWRWRKRKKLLAIRIDNMLRYELSEVLRFIEEHREKPVLRKGKFLEDRPPKKAEGRSVKSEKKGDPKRRLVTRRRKLLERKRSRK